MDAAVTHTCPSCGTQVSPSLLVCPGCKRLIHAAQLASLAQQAEAARQAGEISQALVCWRAALELLPPDVNQFAMVTAQIEQLGAQLDAAGTTSPPLEPSKHRSSVGKALAGLGFFGMLIWKFKVVLLLAASKGKLLLLGLTKSSTFFSMFAFFGVYWAAFGWPLALGVVVSIYIHEMGHVDALRRYGFRATAPMFIPGLGAMIRLQQHPANPSEDARIGLAGPLWGMGAAMACYLLYLATGATIWAALAHLGALINLLNLIPIGSLDGGRGFHALSRSQGLLVTAALGVAWYFSREGLIPLIAVVALYRSVTKAKTDLPDRTAFGTFLLLIALLSSLVCIRAG